MEQPFFENTCETLEILVTATALGAGLGAWGVINLLEAYDMEAAKKEVAADYRSRFDEIDLLLCGVDEEYTTGKIPFARYYALCAEYEAEQNELFDTLYSLDADIKAQKDHGMAQLIRGAGIATIAPAIRNIDNIFAAADKEVIPV